MMQNALTLYGCGSGGRRGSNAIAHWGNELD